MSEAQQSHTVWTAHLDATSGEIAKGDVLCLNAAGNRYILSTEANRTATNRRSAGVAITAADNITTKAVEMQFTGVIPKSFSNLGTGTGDVSIRVSTIGHLERVASPTTDDDVVGRCDADGVAYVNFASVAEVQGVATTPASPEGSIQTNADGTSFGSIAIGDEGDVIKVVDGEWAAAPDEGVALPGAAGDVILSDGTGGADVDNLHFNTSTKEFSGAGRINAGQAGNVVGADAIAVGFACIVGPKGIAIGSSSEAGDKAAAFGEQCGAYGERSLSFGRSCQSFFANGESSGEDSICWPYNAFAKGMFCQTWGNYGGSHGYGSFSLGQSALALGTESCALRGGQVSLSAGAIRSPGDNQISDVHLKGVTPGTDPNESVSLAGTAGELFCIKLEDGKALGVTITATVASVIDSTRVTARMRRTAILYRQGGTTTVDSQDPFTEVITSSDDALGMTLTIGTSSVTFAVGAGVTAKCNISARASFEEVVFPDYAIEDIDGCVLDLDAEVGITLVSSAVSAWADQSSRGDSFNQSTAGARPTVVTTALNSKKAVRFDGVNDFLVQTVGDLSAIIAAGYCDIFIVAIWRSISGTDANALNNQTLLADTGGALGYTGIDYVPTAIMKARAFLKDAGGLDVVDHYVTPPTGGYVGYIGHGGNTELFTMRGDGNGPTKTAILYTAGNTTPLTGLLRLGVNAAGTAFGAVDVLRVLAFKRSERLSISERHLIVGLLREEYGTL